MVAAAVSRLPPVFSMDRRSKVKLLIVPLLPDELVLGRPIAFDRASHALSGGLVEQMDDGRIWLQPHLVTRIELVTLAENRDNLFAAELGENLGLRSRRLDHHDFGFGTVVRNGEMLRPHPVDHRPTVRIGGRGRKRQFDAVRSLENGAAVDPDLAIQEVHRRRTDETGDELIVRTVIEFERRTDLLDNAIM